MTTTKRTTALGRIKSTATKSEWVSSTETLKTEPTSDDKPKGSCVYDVAGFGKACVNYVSKTECESLLGEWKDGLRDLGQVDDNDVPLMPAT